MGVTIKQIAELAGVSAGTVDRALHNRPGIDPQLCKRILAIAKKLDYRPNHAAKTLSEKRKSRKIAIVLHARGNAFYQEILRGMEEAEYACREYNLQLDIRLLKGYDILSQIAQLKELLSADIDGLIITPIADRRVHDLLNEFSRKQIPIVTLNTDLPKNSIFTSVGGDYYGCGHLAAELFGLILPTNTATKIAVVAGSLKQSGHKQRIDGLIDTLENEAPHIRCCEIVVNDDDNEQSYQKVKDLLLQHSDLNGIFFCAGGIRGGLRAVSEMTSPGQLRIITVDETDAVIKGLLGGTVSATISQLPFEQGYRAVRTICDHFIFGTQIQGKRIVMKNEIKLRYHFSSYLQEE